MVIGDGDVVSPRFVPRQLFIAQSGPHGDTSFVRTVRSLIADIGLARKKQGDVRVIPTSQAINQSVDLAHEIFNRVFRKVPERMNG